MSAWENHYNSVIAKLRKRQIIQAYLSQFWIWRPYSKISFNEQELHERGYENLGNSYMQKDNDNNLKKD